MLGLGRAIGETMIVLWPPQHADPRPSPLNGMRTMPAAHRRRSGVAARTLNCVLLLTGALLFVFTFFLNTACDVEPPAAKCCGQF
jgi:ABC-type phosphate transport system permease subunit